ncbi:hypothetical protein FSP39_023044 [Pinctada imbricata]|uniref:Uncharacterized protein n=1 Tax=Pinctada imbricata TaxID=66713 RepID=A0AA89C8K5_PINIB|nr:hypothetical protein FSP39_023044 [Pinctada imbricata]
MRKTIGKIHKSTYSNSEVGLDHDVGNIKSDTQAISENKHAAVTKFSHKSQGIIRCEHTELSRTCTFCMTNAFTELVSNLPNEEKASVFEYLIYMMSQADKEVLAYHIGSNESHAIRNDAQSFAMMYKDVNTISSFDISRWLCGRNEVLKNFMLGVGQLNSVDRVDKGKTIVLAAAMEQSYKLCLPSLVSPFAFLQNLCLYTLTGSKTAVNIFGRTAPSGGYKTIFKWLYDQKTTPPVCPAGETMNVFDKEQVVRRKTAIKPNSKAKVSIIANKGITQLSEECLLQSNETLKHLYLSTCSKRDTIPKEHEEELKAAALEVINPENEQYRIYETLHYEQLFPFIEIAMKCVLEETEDSQSNKGLFDFIDEKITCDDERDKFVKGTLCGTLNSKRKQICIGFKEKEGIRTAKSLLKENSDAESIHQPQKSQVTFQKIQFRINSNDSTGTVEGHGNIEITSTLDVEECERYDHFTSNHRSKKEIVLSDPVFCNPNSLQTVALVLRQIGIENGISRYISSESSDHDDNMRHWTFVCCECVPYLICKKLKD